MYGTYIGQNNSSIGYIHCKYITECLCFYITNYIMSNNSTIYMCGSNAATLAIGNRRQTSMLIIGNGRQRYYTATRPNTSQVKPL